jgi:hypothetical protein
LLDLLANRIRPVFQSHAHPSVNPGTGRKLARAAGGPSASQDMYVSQIWKEECPGVGNVVLWVVKHIEVRVLCVCVEECVEREACMYRAKITRDCGIWLFHRR